MSFRELKDSIFYSRSKKYYEEILKELNRFKNEIIESSIVGYAIGDALGTQVENRTRDDLRLNPVLDFSDKNINIEKGRWSSNTTLTLYSMDAITNVLYNDTFDICKKLLDNFMELEEIKNHTLEPYIFNIESLTSKSIIKYKRKLHLYEKGEIDINELITNGDNNITTASNASLARIVPISIYAETLEDDEEYVNMIYRATAITHNHAINKIANLIYSKFLDFIINGDDSVIAYSKTKKYFKDNNDMLIKLSGSSYLKNIILFDRILKDDINTLEEKDIISNKNAIETLEAVMWVILNTTNFKEALLKAVNLGNNSNVITALTGAIAAILYEKESVPIQWESNLISLVDIKKKIFNYQKRLKYPVVKRECVNGHHIDQIILDNLIMDLINDPAKLCSLVEEGNASIYSGSLKVFSDYFFEYNKSDFSYVNTIKQIKDNKEIRDYSYNECIALITSFFRKDKFKSGYTHEIIITNSFLPVVVRLKELTSFK